MRVWKARDSQFHARPCLRLAVSSWENPSLGSEVHSHLACSDICRWLWCCRPTLSSPSLQLVCPCSQFLLSVSSLPNRVARVPGNGPVCHSALPATLCPVRSGSDSRPDTHLSGGEALGLFYCFLCPVDYWRQCNVLRTMYG